MRRAPRPETRVASRVRAGFTLIEVLASLTILMAVFYGLSRAVDLAKGAEDTVSGLAQQNRQMRELSRGLSEELSQTTEDELGVTTLADGNHELTFRQPMLLDGELTWGVETAVRGRSVQTFAMQDWSLRYTVQQAADGGKALVRQVLDDEGELYEQETVVASLLDERGQQGFSVEKAGDIWRVAFTAVDEAGDDSGKETVIHVRIRN